MCLWRADSYKADAAHCVDILKTIVRGNIPVFAFPFEQKRLLLPDKFLPELRDELAPWLK